MIALAERVLSPKPIVYDGSKGVYLSDKVPHPGDPTDILNLISPDIVRQVHKQYIQAGSELIQTNTFCANALRLSLSNLADRTYEINMLGAKIAKSVAKDKVYVAGDIGPTGHLLTPYGDYTQAQFVQAFIPQVRGLIDGAVDVIHIETMSAPEEVAAAIQAVKEVNPKFPIMVTMTFDKPTPKGMRTMMGAGPADLITLSDQNGLLAYGANCGIGLLNVDTLVAELRNNNPHAVLVTKFNAGQPTMIDSVPVYPENPDSMAQHALRMYDMGVKIIGACCGSTPAHIEAMANILSQRSQFSF